MIQTKKIPEPIVVGIVSVTVVNNTTYTRDITVPAGQRWRLLWSTLRNPDDVTRNAQINLFLEAAKTNHIAFLAYYNALDAASIQALHVPANKFSTEASDIVYRFLGLTAYPIELEAGWTLEYQLEAGGASAGGTDADGIIYVYKRVF